MANLMIRVILLLVTVNICAAQLRQNFYANVCPKVESIVQGAVAAKLSQTFVTIPATLRLLFHDCLVQGCDSSIMISSTANNVAEKDNPDNLSLAGDGFDTVIKAKAAVDAFPQCKNKVSCADILVMAARDVIALAGGPSYAVELGRLDGLISTSASVTGKLPQPSFDLNQLNSIFESHGLNQIDMIALSAAHSVGFSHCSRFANRLYSFSQTSKVDPTLNRTYAAQLESECPQNVDPRIAIDMDPITPQILDNQYYKNLKMGMGLFTSDQSLFTDGRSRPTVDAWAQSSQAFQQAFVTAMTKLGRVGVKTDRSQGNIRIDCSQFN